MIFACRISWNVKNWCVTPANGIFLATYLVKCQIINTRHKVHVLKIVLDIFLEKLNQITQKNQTIKTENVQMSWVEIRKNITKVTLEYIHYSEFSNVIFNKAKCLNITTMYCSDSFIVIT